MAEGELEARIDGVYREPPERFVAARNALAAELRAAGEREAADRVRELRRPTAVAWLANRLSLDHRDAVRELTALADQLRETQERLLAGEADAGELRAAAAREREAIDRLVAEARGLAGESERRIGERAFEQLAETLRAAGADPEVRDRLEAARLEHEHSAATLGTPLTPGPAPAAPPKARRARAKPAPKAKRAKPAAATPTEAEPAKAERERERARRRELRIAALRTELRRAEEREAAAQERVSELEAELRDARSTRAERRREATQARKRLREAERRAPGR